VTSKFAICPSTSAQFPIPFFLEAVRPSKPIGANTDGCQQAQPLPQVTQNPLIWPACDLAHFLVRPEEFACIVSSEECYLTYLEAPSFQNVS
jgi:hypothetical protein